MAFTKAGLYQQVCLSTAGKPLAQVAVTVYLTGTTTLATLYTDQTAGTTRANPVQADAYGNLAVYAAPGFYDLTYGGVTVTIEVPVHQSEVAPLAAAVRLPGAPLGASRFVPPLNIGQPQTIFSDGTYNAFPGLCKTSTGRLVCTFVTGASHAPTTSSLKAMYSDNEGASWSTPTTVYPAVANIAQGPILLTTVGSVIYGIGWDSDRSFSPQKARLIRTKSTDNGVTWDAKTALAQQPFSYNAYTECPIVVLPNGTWLTAATGANSTSLLNSTAVGWSTDLGVTWSWTTVKDGIADNVVWDEPTLSILPNGSIQLLIRRLTSGFVADGMWRMVSADNGVTWSAAVKVFDGEARPNQVTTSSGLSVCYNRSIIDLPGLGGRMGAVRFSTDNGVTWSAEQYMSFGLQTNDYTQAYEHIPGVMAVATCNEFSNSRCDIIFLYVTEGGAVSPLKDGDESRQPARVVSRAMNVIAYDSGQRTDENPLGRMDSGHHWANFGGGSHQLVGGIIKGTLASECVSAFEMQRTDAGEISAEMRPGTGANFGLLMQVQDSANFYQLGMNGSSGALNVELIKKIAGVYTSLQLVAGQNLVYGSWYPVRVVFVGGRFRVYVDGDRLIDVTDSTLTGKTLAGVRTTNTTDAIRNFVVTSR